MTSRVVARRGNNLFLVVTSDDPFAPARVFSASDGAYIDAPPLSAAALLKHGYWTPVEDGDEVPDGMNIDNEAKALVRTPAGARRFGQPINSVIVRDTELVPDKLTPAHLDTLDWDALMQVAHRYGIDNQDRSRAITMIVEHVAEHGPIPVGSAQVPTREDIDAIFAGEFADGFTVHVTNVGKAYGGVRVAGEIFHRDAPMFSVGKFIRIFAPDSRTVMHETLILDPEFRRRGFTRAWLAHTEAAYYALGYRKIKVHAGDEDGPIVWARLGFHFTDDRLPQGIYYALKDLASGSSYWGPSPDGGGKWTHNDPSAEEIARVTTFLKPFVDAYEGDGSKLMPEVTPMDIFNLGPGATNIMMQHGWFGYKPLRRPELKGLIERLALDPMYLEVVPRTHDRADARTAAMSRLERFEEMFADTLERFYARQAEVVLARLRGKQARKGTRHWTGSVETKAIDVDRVLDPTRWRAEIEDDAERVVLAITRGAISATAQDLAEDNLDLSLSQPGLQAAIRERIQRIMSVTEARAEQIRKVIMDADASEADLEEIVNLVKGTYDQRRIWAQETAREEVAGIVNGGSFEAAKLAGVTTKSWLSSHDEKVRPTHRLADGQAVALELPFLVGGHPLMYPGDPLGPIQETINCRCVMLFDRAVPSDRPDIAANPLIVESPADYADRIEAVTRAVSPTSPLADKLTALSPTEPGEPADRWLALVDALRRHAAALRWRTAEKLAEAAGIRTSLPPIARVAGLDASLITTLTRALRARESAVEVAGA